MIPVRFLHFTLIVGVVLVLTPVIVSSFLQIDILGICDRVGKGYLRDKRKKSGKKVNRRFHDEVLLGIVSCYPGEYIVDPD